jgi:hypothetical protein
MLNTIDMGEARSGDPRAKDLRLLVTVVPKGWNDGFRYREWGGAPPTRYAELVAQAELARREKAGREAARQAATREGQQKRAATLAAQAGDELRRNARGDAARHAEAIEPDAQDNADSEAADCGARQHLAMSIMGNLQGQWQVAYLR